MKILAIETSHDDTSVVLYQDRKILLDISTSQVKHHAKFGGTVPEIASRRHYTTLAKVIPKLLSSYSLFDIDHIAYTREPGLIGSLHMGRLFAQGLGMALNKRVVPINHMHAHIFAVAFSSTISFPAVALIVSGGHTQLWEVRSYHQLKLLGETKDDAIGEVYDKVGRALNLPFPGGPELDKIAQKATSAIDFSIKESNEISFSFSGLKTKVMKHIKSLPSSISPKDFANIAAGFQHAAINNLVHKTNLAIEKVQPRSIVLGGGVAANSLLRELFVTLHEKALLPELRYTTDNAAMIAITSDLQSNSYN